MYTRTTIKKQLLEGHLDARLAQIYGCAPQDVMDQVTRYTHILKGFDAQFTDNDSSEVGLYSAPGRTEIGGNHTDHQLGCVLAGSVDLDAIAAAAQNDGRHIRFYSEGYPLMEIDLEDLGKKESETDTTMAIIRGMAHKITAMGYTLSGFDAYAISSVLGGSGLSSSAAFETLVGVIINDLFCQGALTPVEIAQIGQYAENEYFGKPCGLMDQTASAVGGVVAIDFKDKANPVVEKIDFDFASSGYHLCIVDSKSDHADLTEDYVAIPKEMGRVAEIFGKTHLREVPVSAFIKRAAAVREKAGDRSFLRAYHFFMDNDRAQKEAQALRDGDFQQFLEDVKASGQSSYMYLQNTAQSGAVSNQAVNVALALCENLLGGEGAFRVHGGGFAGTVQAFVPNHRLDQFRKGIENCLGEKSCMVLTIRPVGGVAL